jgi:glycosyl hydrolase family 99
MMGITGRMRSAASVARSFSPLRLAAAVAVTSLSLAGAGVGITASPGYGQPPTTSTSPPVFAYYYMWMQGSYWLNNKMDHPVQPFPGDYRSEDPAVIDWQIRQAKLAGIGGFIVAWKDTLTYRRIVPLVEEAANRQQFSLILQYEALDAARHPLPLSTVAADFKYFVANYADNPAWYRIGGKPVTIFHDTRWFAAADISAVTRPVRSRIKVLNSANSVAEYHRVSLYTDGDAYYWSSVDPATNPGWKDKLKEIGAAVHTVAGKTWIAPFAPGFDATLIGGHIIVPRYGGEMLRVQYAAAAASSPDIMGLISWNEWTENTHVEPSVNFGDTYLNLLASLVAPAGPATATGVAGPTIPVGCASAPRRRSSSAARGGLLSGGSCSVVPQPRRQSGR